MYVFKNTEYGRAVEDGKQALEGQHRELVKEERGIKCHKSLNFDLICKKLKQLPEKRRWDYLISTNKKPETIIAVEVHNFRVSDLISKKQGTIDILKKHAPLSVKNIQHWRVIVKGDLRNDLKARFEAETKIKLCRQLSLSELA